MKTGIVGACVLGLVAIALVEADAGEPADDIGRELWERVEASPAETSSTGARPAVRLRRYAAYRLDREGMAARLAQAPDETSRAARDRRLVLALPAPDGRFLRFAVHESPIMEPGLAAKHPDIKTYAGRGIDNPATTIRFDLTPLGFHASVRGREAAGASIPTTTSTRASTRATPAATCRGTSIRSWSPSSPPPRSPPTRRSRAPSRQARTSRWATSSGRTGSLSSPTPPTPRTSAAPRT